MSPNAQKVPSEALIEDLKLARNEFFAACLMDLEIRGKTYKIVSKWFEVSEGVLKRFAFGVEDLEHRWSDDLTDRGRFIRKCRRKRKLWGYIRKIRSLRLQIEEAKGLEAAQGVPA